MYIYTYSVYLYIMQQKKKQKKTDLLPLGSLFLMGLN